MQLLGETSFTKKITISVLEKFETKIFVIGESCDLQTLTITKLTNKFHAQKQRVSISSNETIECVF
ncbi:hypothetical protein CR513_61499, partial [Mucuna pruriens]